MKKKPSFNRVCWKDALHERKIANFCGMFNLKTICGQNVKFKEFFNFSIGLKLCSIFCNFSTLLAHFTFSKAMLSYIEKSSVLAFTKLEEFLIGRCQDWKIFQTNPQLSIKSYEFSVGFFLEDYNRHRKSVTFID